MPLALIQIEEMAAGKWHAEVEVGFPRCRRSVINAASFDEVMLQVIDAYRAELPIDPVYPVSGPLPPIDEAILPHLPPPPVGKVEAQEMRDRADAGMGIERKRRGRPPRLS